MMADEERALSQLYADPSAGSGGAFSDEDKELAEVELGEPLSQMLNALEEELQRQLGSDLWLLVLYGSHARGEAQPDSDVDLFIVLRQASEAAYEKARQVAYEVMWEADFAHVFSLYLTDVDHCRMLEQYGSSFLRNVQREGKVLWEAA